MTPLHILPATLFALILTAPATAGIGPTIVQSVAASGDAPTPADNDFTRINDAVQAAADGAVIELQGTFDWTETNAAASWALGSDGVAATGDEFFLAVPPLDDLTITAASLGDAVIQGPGDLPDVDLEGVFDFTSSGGGGNYLNLTISNLTILDFDLPIGMFHGGGAITAFSGTTVTNNYILMPADLPGNFSLAVGEPFQNIGIHYSFGDNQTISDNVIEIPGDGLSDRSDMDPGNHLTAASIAMQSNTSGGAYEGLLIDGNEIRILSAQSADPETIYGIWENGHAHTRNITVSNNRFLNLAAGNDPTQNLQGAFRVTSHSSLASTVTYNGNWVQGANLGMAQLTGFGGQDFSAHEPIQVTGNTFLDNATAVLIRSSGSDVLRCNRFFGNDLAIGNEGVLADADALENWFGCNAGPGFGSCDTVDSDVDVSPWITMGLSINDPSLKAGETATVTADLLRNSGGGFASCTVPDGAPAIFSAANGSMTPEMATLTSGLAQSTFTAGGEDGFATVAALIDGEVQGLFVTVDATETDLAVTKTDGLLESDPGTTLDYVIVVTNDGPSDVTGAMVDDPLAPQLTGCTWTCTPTAGADCAAGGSGAIDDLVDLPAGTSVQYDLSCTFQPAAEESVNNTVTVTAPAGITDLDPGNDSATDTTHATLTIFTDGFESGNTSAWSSTVP
jgi:uncharacterized repeat protein (TIGR01451 family)